METSSVLSRTLCPPGGHGRPYLDLGRPSVFPLAMSSVTGKPGSSPCYRRRTGTSGVRTDTQVVSQGSGRWRVSGSRTVDPCGGRCRGPPSFMRTWVVHSSTHVPSCPGPVRKFDRTLTLPQVGDGCGGHFYRLTKTRRTLLCVGQRVVSGSRPRSVGRELRNGRDSSPHGDPWEEVEA